MGGARYDLAMVGTKPVLQGVGNGGVTGGNVWGERAVAIVVARCGLPAIIVLKADDIVFIGWVGGVGVLPNFGHDTPGIDSD